MTSSLTKKDTKEDIYFNTYFSRLPDFIQKTLKDQALREVEEEDRKDLERKMMDILRAGKLPNTQRANDDKKEDIKTRLQQKIKNKCRINK